MKRFFSKPKPSREERFSAALAVLERNRKLLLQGREKYQSRANSHLARAKKSVQEGQTDMARGWLQQRVRAMDHIHKIDQQLNSVNQQIQSIELNAMTVNTVQGLQTTRETLAAVQISAGPDRISNLADAAAELMEETEECADAVGLSSISHSSALQEESIDEQLKSLMLGSIDLPTEQPRNRLQSRLLPQSLVTCHRWLSPKSQKKESKTNCFSGRIHDELLFNLLLV